jgi:uncharacterized linocin/CFP29 family protein
LSLGREAVGWSDEVWSRLDLAVAEEIRRSGMTERLLPLRPALAGATTVPADVIELDTMTVDETQVAALVETAVPFGLTRQQTDGEAEQGTAVTLATRAASLLSQAEDVLVFQGDGAAKLPLFQRVAVRGATGRGLVAAAPEEVVVTAKDGRFGDATAAGVAQACAKLQTAGHYGPYALALDPDVYADAFTPLDGTLVAPGDRLAQLATHAFVGTGALPNDTGVVVSIGGDVIDVVVGQDPVIEFTAVEGDGTHRFRVFERFVVRIKDPSAIVRMRFRRG